jgi:hypothetical protein
MALGYVLEHHLREQLFDVGMGEILQTTPAHREGLRSESPAAPA